MVQMFNGSCKTLWIFSDKIVIKQINQTKRMICSIDGALSKAEKHTSGMIALKTHDHLSGLWRCGDRTCYESRTRIVSKAIIIIILCLHMTHIVSWCSGYFHDWRGFIMVKWLWWSQRIRKRSWDVAANWISLLVQLKLYHSPYRATFKL